MYNLTEVTGVDSSLGQLSFLAERIKCLCDYAEKGYKIIVFFYESPDYGTFRYRVYNVIQILKKSPLWKGVYFSAEEWDDCAKYLAPIDLLCIVRVRWSERLNRILGKMRLMNVPIIFDIDDLVYDLDYFQQVVNIINVATTPVGLSDDELNFWASCIARIDMTASNAQVYVATNDFLIGLLEKKYTAPYYSVIPNFLNEEQLFVSSMYRIQKQLVGFKEPFTIGYFSGTSTHENDFSAIFDEIAQILNEFPHVNLKIVGFMGPLHGMHEFIQKKRISITPLVDFVELQRLIAEVDVNIVPLVESTFTNCKSELKFFESAIVNTITVATPIYSYNKIIRHGENGFLCRQGQWYSLLKKIILKQFELESITERALRDTLSLYSGETIYEIIHEQYRLILESIENENHRK